MTWPEAVYSYARSLRGMIYRHVAAAPLLNRATLPVRSLEYVDAYREVLVLAGLTDRQAIQSLRAVHGYALGFALACASPSTSATTTRPTSSKPDWTSWSRACAPGCDGLASPCGQGFARLAGSCQSDRSPVTDAGPAALRAVAQPKGVTGIMRPSGEDDSGTTAVLDTMSDQAVGHFHEQGSTHRTCRQQVFDSRRADRVVGSELVERSTADRRGELFGRRGLAAADHALGQNFPAVSSDSWPGHVHHRID